MKPVSAASQSSCSIGILGSSTIASKSLFSTPKQEPIKELDDTSALSKRELDVLKELAQGHSNKEVARSLSISIRTVETHRQNIKQKLDIHTTAGLTRYAIECGLVD